VSQYGSLFPPIYNEDWFFLFDAVQRRSVAVAGTAKQREYQPFARPARAATEEFGDLIGEGLYRLLHQGAGVGDATHEYWRGALEQRQRLIDDVAARLLSREVRVPLIGSALMSLAAARKRLGMISALSCVSFVRAWQEDVEAWQHRLDELQVVGDLPGAAKFLDLPVPESCVSI
jgi:hypothetical protein